MEIILLENILNLGNIGDKVAVKNGYGRNFLLKKGKALRFSKENQEFVNKKKDELNKKNTELKNKYKEIAKLVNNKVFIFNKESKENGELYGSIKPKEITNLIKEKVNADVSPSQIILKNDLNTIGEFKADINATIVFPLPTSPCNNLNILLFEDKSLFISNNDFFWSFVRLKFNFDIVLI